MSYEEWRLITQLMLDFFCLTKQEQEMVFLFMDGLKYREEKNETYGGQNRSLHQPGR